MIKSKVKFSVKLFLKLEFLKPNGPFDIDNHWEMLQWMIWLINDQTNAHLWIFLAQEIQFLVKFDTSFNKDNK